VRILVFGATGGTGRAVVSRALREGHTVTAFVRQASKLEPASGLEIVEGDAMHAEDVKRAICGDPDAIVVTLGNPQGSLARLMGARRTTAADVCKTGTRNIIAALPPDSTVPVVVVSAFGVGQTRDRLPFAYRLFYALLLREQIADKERQEALLKETALDYVIVQPVALTDKPGAGTWTASPEGTIGRGEVSREDLAAYIMQILTEGIPSRRTIAFSG
jgi:uncharacterized protein YbjT (DUF2867 family)